MQSGYVYSKAAPQLVLGLSEQKLTAHLSHPVYGRSETRVSGLAVGVQRKLHACAAQMWTFCADGNIYCQVCVACLQCLECLQCFDAVGWAAERASGL